jgi:hypothetical protein
MVYEHLGELMVSGFWLIAVIWMLRFGRHLDRYRPQPSCPDGASPSALADALCQSLTDSPDEWEAWHLPAVPAGGLRHKLTFFELRCGNGPPVFYVPFVLSFAPVDQERLRRAIECYLAHRINDAWAAYKEPKAPAQDSAPEHNSSPGGESR